MLRVLRPQDTLSMAVRLQSSMEGLARYLAVVSTIDESDTREVGILGFDYISSEKITFVFSKYKRELFNTLLNCFSITNFKLKILFIEWVSLYLYSARQKLNSMEMVASKWIPITLFTYSNLCPSKQCGPFFSACTK